MRLCSESVLPRCPKGVLPCPEAVAPAALLSAPVLFSLPPVRANNLRVHCDSFTFGRPNSFKGRAICIGKRLEHIVKQGRCGRIGDDPKAAAACLLAWCTLAPDHPTKDHVKARASTRQELLMRGTIEYGAQGKTHGRPYPGT